MSDLIKIREENKILELAFNRPEKKNAINLGMYQTLVDQIAAAPKAGVRVILLYGIGDCFTSGNDMADFASGADLSADDNPIMAFLRTVLACPIPIVVAVQGRAVGIGTTLLLHCDLVVADNTAQFRLPFANLGLCPEFASSVVLPRLVGHVKAAEWLMLGEFISAEEAKNAGLINTVAEEPLVLAREYAMKLAKQPPAALRHTKALMKGRGRAELESVIKNEIEVFAEALKGPEFAEAATAFFEKRAPDFSTFE